VIILGAAAIGWSVLAAMSSVGFSIGMAIPIAAGILLVFWAIWHLKYRKPLIKTKWLRIAAVSCAGMGMAAVIVIESLMTAAAAAKPDNAADTVIVLGCGIFEDGRPTLSLQNRLETACAYLKEHTGACVVVTGGKGDNEPVAEAAAMQAYLVSHGVDPSRIYTEDKSTSTEENMKYAMSIVDNNGLSRHTAIVTSDYHMLRALWCARELGFDAYGLASPTPWRVWLSCHVREWLAIIKTALFQDLEIRIE